jgi:hypothetical protein
MAMPYVNARKVRSDTSNAKVAIRAVSRGRVVHGAAIHRAAPTIAIGSAQLSGVESDQ